MLSTLTVDCASGLESLDVTTLRLPVTGVGECPVAYVELCVSDVVGGG